MLPRHVQAGDRRRASACRCWRCASPVSSTFSTSAPRVAVDRQHGADAVDVAAGVVARVADDPGSVAPTLMVSAPSPALTVVAPLMARTLTMSSPAWPLMIGLAARAGAVDVDRSASSSAFTVSRPLAPLMLTVSWPSAVLTVVLPPWVLVMVNVLSPVASQMFRVSELAVVDAELEREAAQGRRGQRAGLVACTAGLESSTFRTSVPIAAVHGQQPSMPSIVRPVWSARRHGRRIAAYVHRVVTVAAVDGDGAVRGVDVEDVVAVIAVEGRDAAGARAVDVDRVGVAPGR